MKIEAFIEAVEAAASKYALRIIILARTANAVKMRLEISENIFVQFYYNQLSDVHNYVLVGWNHRLYGRGSIGKRWHRHSFDAPDAHDIGEEGTREVSPLEFLDEVFEILSKEGLI